jgi:phenylalanyl-tRNA synthetase beta chain
VEEDAVPEALRLQEPISLELAVLRTELLPSLVEAARRNVEVGNERVALFEIARVYLPRGENELPEERLRVAGIAEGDFLHMKGAIEALLRTLHTDSSWARSQHRLLHPGRAAAIHAGIVGELHPALLEGAWGVFELDLETLAGAAREAVPYEDVITYPAVRQDIAVAVDEGVEVGALVDAARDAAGPILREARVFDVYRGEQVGEGRKSVAIHLAFQSSEGTLTDEQAAALRGKIVEALAERFDAELRA